MDTHKPVEKQEEILHEAGVDDTNNISNSQKQVEQKEILHEALDTTLGEVETVINRFDEADVPAEDIPVHIPPEIGVEDIILSSEVEQDEILPDISEALDTKVDTKVLENSEKEVVLYILSSEVAEKEITKDFTTSHHKTTQVKHHHCEHINLKHDLDGVLGSPVVIKMDGSGMCKV